tara:strand:+ start:10464 stop:11393 length:930 start_codon:yes stop_codon:yes gene_type:complete
MSRHILISNGTGAGYTNGVLAEGAISPQKRTSGSVSPFLTALDTVASAPEFRFIQGASDGINKVSPWIYAKDVLSVGGRTNANPTVQNTTLLFGGSGATEKGTVFIKLINYTDGLEPYGIVYYEVPVAVGDTSIALRTKVFNVLNADLPDWITGLGGIFTFLIIEGKDRTSTTSAPQTRFDIFIEMVSSDDSIGINGITIDKSLTALPSPGVGSGIEVAIEEKNNFGTMYGFYERTEEAIPPEQTAVEGTNHNMYYIVASKNRSAQQHIHKVDDRIELIIAIPPGAAETALAAIMQPYLADAGHTWPTL